MIRLPLFVAITLGRGCLSTGLIKTRAWLPTAPPAHIKPTV